MDRGRYNLMVLLLGALGELAQVTGATALAATRARAAAWTG
jgi:hypothetical protein